MSMASGVFFVVSLVILIERLFFAGVFGFAVPAYAAVIASLFGFLLAFFRSLQIKRRPRSKNKLKKLRRARALMALNVIVCVAAAAIWFSTLIRLL
ncbi:MAG TPA: hypothetical protein VN512_01295 [Clostridia bacterium]|nr:hypothetical protein [Clostridia bacterium]